MLNRIFSKNRYGLVIKSGQTTYPEGVLWNLSIIGPVRRIITNSCNSDLCEKIRCNRNSAVHQLGDWTSKQNPHYRLWKTLCETFPIVLRSSQLRLLIKLHGVLLRKVRLHIQLALLTKKLFQKLLSNCWWTDFQIVFLRNLSDLYPASS